VSLKAHFHINPRNVRSSEIFPLLFQFSDGELLLSTFAPNANDHLRKGVRLIKG
jgi:hypothetical protein